MGLLDILFGKDEEPWQMQGDIIGPTIDTIKGKTVIIGEFNSENKDPSKAIDSKHWDALSLEAQKALKEQGFYPSIRIE